MSIPSSLPVQDRAANNFAGASSSRGSLTPNTRKKVAEFLLDPFGCDLTEQEALDIPTIAFKTLASAEEAAESSGKSSKAHILHLPAHTDKFKETHGEGSSNTSRSSKDEKIESVGSNSSLAVCKPILVSDYIRWTPKVCSPEDAAKKMLKNMRKAIVEHRDEKLARASFASEDVAIPTIDEILHPKTVEPLTLTHVIREEQGIRPTMEDAQFYITLQDGTLAGLFDGHSGKEVADFVNGEIPKRFPDLLAKADGNVHQAFSALFDEVQQEIIKRVELHNAGSTAVLIYIDRKTNLIYTATLGDSEANIYRKIDGKLKSIPLSCVRDWSSEKDEARAIGTLPPSEIAAFKDETYSKLRRYNGSNVSRAFGDIDLIGTKEAPAIINKPKITVNILKPDDIVLLVCDGVKDFVPENEIVGIVEVEKVIGPGSIASRLTIYSLLERLSEDNVSVLAIHAKPAILTK